MSYYVSFRGFRACPCLAAWLPVYEAELQRRGTLTGPLRLYQLVGGAEASGGTHATGGAFDISDLVGDTDVWVARQMGADATWARGPKQGFIPHLHGVLTGCPHNGPARYQIADVARGMNGLAGSSRAADDGPRPLSGRTWLEGIAWAKEQQEESDMASPETIKQLVEALTPVLEKAVAGNKLDVGKPAKWADDTVAQTLIEQNRKILAELSALNRRLAEQAARVPRKP